MDLNEFRRERTKMRKSKMISVRISKDELEWLRTNKISPTKLFYHSFKKVKGGI